MAETVLFIGMILGPVLFAAVIVSTIELEQAPRGLRWTPKAWAFLARNIEWAFLRVFYPERVKPEPPAVQPDLRIEALEIWHACYELGHAPDECDNIAFSHPVLWTDVIRRHRMLKAKELRK